ncbi:protein of unknown function [Rhodovastum atsumiense]|nr:protein of unknown function [Rhodovastum atsumiense]
MESIQTIHFRYPVAFPILVSSEDSKDTGGRCNVDHHAVVVAAPATSARRGSIVMDDVKVCHRLAQLRHAPAVGGT